MSRVLWAVIVAGLPAVAGAVEVGSGTTFTGKVVSIQDGDSLRVLDAAKVQHRVRLEGIDAPEHGQPFGNVARERMAELAMGKAVSVHVTGTDMYGRTLARVEADGRDVGRQIVADGLAWHYKRYSADVRLAAAEADARAAGRGLWADRQPVPPWEWRATERERKRQPAQR